MCVGGVGGGGCLVVIFQCHFTLNTRRPPKFFGYKPPLSVKTSCLTIAGINPCDLYLNCVVHAAPLRRGTALHQLPAVQ